MNRAHAKRVLTGGAATLFISLFHFACAAPEPAEEMGGSALAETDGTATTGKDDDEKSAPAAADTSSSGTCPGAGPPLDVSGFAPCLDGGRCVPEAVIPEKERTRLAACDTGLCVPEKILAAAGNYLPKTCASLAGAEGRCTSIVFPDLNAQKDVLPLDVCDKNERCAPCFDPTNGTETGACSSVSCDAPKKPKVVFKDCCIQKGKPRGKCIPTSSIPEADRDGLDVKECGSEDLRCAPIEQVNEETPPKCVGEMLFLGDYEGVCISDCVHMVSLKELWTYLV
jgi:hypothetical protein